MHNTMSGTKQDPESNYLIEIDFESWALWPAWTQRPAVINSTLGYACSQDIVFLSHWSLFIDMNGF